MHRWLIGVLVVGSGLEAWAAPIPGLAPTPPPVPVRVQEEAGGFARMALGIATQISNQYVRDVKRNDLAAAAIAGLYEAAREPIPAALRRDLEGEKTIEEMLALLNRARQQLGDREEVRGGAAILAACRGMARKLDPHSGVVTGEALRRGIGVDEQTGFGLEVAEYTTMTGPLKIQFVYPGGPAQSAGLRPGDIITHIDGKQLNIDGPSNPLEAWIAGALKAAVEQKEQQVKLVPEFMEEEVAEAPVTIRRGEKSWTVKLQRKTFQPETVLGVTRRDDNSWNYWLDPQRKIAHVRISGFGNTTALDLRNALDKLQEEELRGLILDVRWCPGGYLRQAVQAASLFLGDGDIATIMTRTDEETSFKNLAEKRYRDFPMVVLVNGETTGGAELIAAALQDYKRAKIMGTRTAGKGNVQIHLPIGVDDAGFKLTTRTLLRPSKKNLNRFPDSGPNDDWGVRPHEELRISTDLSKQLKEWWLLQTLRPGGDRERLPLDDPAADTQRQAALEELTKKRED